MNKINRSCNKAAEPSGAQNSTQQTAQDNMHADSGGRTHRWRITARILAAATAMMLMFTACGAQAATSGASGTSGTSGTQTVASDTSDTSDTSDKSGTSDTSDTATGYTAAGKADQFTERDLSGDYDEAAAVRITLNGSTASAAEKGTGATGADVSIDGSTITITAEGTYIFSGTLTDGMIIVEADDSAKVQLVLDGADITSKTSAAIYVRSADKVFVTTAEGTENTLANGGAFTAIDDSNIDGAIFAKDDVTINGNGVLTVTSPAGHGIVGKDDVKIAGGTISITAAKHGIQANDSARFAEAEVSITAGTDGVHVSDNSDAEEGTASDSYFYNADAALTIEAVDDGIHADAQVLSEAGSITVTGSYEGIEGLTIGISGGDIDVTATDDGLNAAGGSNTTNPDSTFGDDDWAGGKGGFPGGGFSEGGTDGMIRISGGSLHISAGGDGLDSNGSVEIGGGTTIVEGPSSGDTSVLDYNGTAAITGGTFIGTGGAGMAENFSSVENQGLIAVSVGSQSAGAAVRLTDAGGKVIAEQTPELDYSVVYISTSGLQQGGTYTLTAGSYSETIELTDSMYSTLSRGMGGRGKGGFGDMSGGGQNGQDMSGDGSDMNGGPQNRQGMHGGPQNDSRLSGDGSDMNGGPQNRQGMRGGHGKGMRGGPQSDSRTNGNGTEETGSLNQNTEESYGI